MTASSVPPIAPTRRRVRWKHPEAQACYERLRERLFGWGMHQAYVHEALPQEFHRLTCYGLWRVSRTAGGPLVFEVRDLRTAAWEPCRDWWTGSGKGPLIPLMPAFRDQSSPYVQCEGALALHYQALHRLCASDALYETLPDTYGSIIQTVLGRALTPRFTKRRKGLRSPHVIVLRGLRKVLWTHFLDKDLASPLAKIFWPGRVELQDYALLERHQSFVRAYQASWPRALPWLRLIPERHWSSRLLSASGWVEPVAPVFASDAKGKGRPQLLRWPSEALVEWALDQPVGVQGEMHEWPTRGGVPLMEALREAPIMARPLPSTVIQELFRLWHTMPEDYICLPAEVRGMTSEQTHQRLAHAMVSLVHQGWQVMHTALPSEKARLPRTAVPAFVKATRRALSGLIVSAVRQADTGWEGDAAWAWGTLSETHPWRVREAARALHAAMAMASTPRTSRRARL